MPKQRLTCRTNSQRCCPSEGSTPVKIAHTFLSSLLRTIAVSNASRSLFPLVLKSTNSLSSIRGLILFLQANLQLLSYTSYFKILSSTLGQRAGQIESP